MQRQQLLLPHESIGPFEPEPHEVAAEDDGSDSLRTPESDIDVIETLSDNHQDLHHAQGQGYSYQVLHNNNLQLNDTDIAFPAPEYLLKEEDDYWFTNLNLEDLQNSLATFGTTPLQDHFSYHDSFSMTHGLPY